MMASDSKPNYLIDKFGMNLFFSITFAYLIMLGSTHPFQNVDMLSNAMTIGSGFVLLTPSLIIIFTGQSSF